MNAVSKVIQLVVNKGEKKTFWDSIKGQGFS
jgi:hypothetical protein